MDHQSKPKKQLMIEEKGRGSTDIQAAEAGAERPSFGFGYENTGIDPLTCSINTSSSKKRKIDEHFDIG